MPIKLPNSIDLWKPFLKQLNYQHFDKIILDINIDELEIFLNKVCLFVKYLKKTKV